MSMKPVLSRQGGGKGVKKASQDTIRGIPQSEIDAKRGYRDHVDKITPEMIQEDYKRIGADISLAQAVEIRDAVWDYTSTYGTWRYREALEKQKKGESLNDLDKKLIRQHELINEYMRVAPTYKGNDGGNNKYGMNSIVRAIHDTGNGYVEYVRTLNKGDIFTLDMVASFTSRTSSTSGFTGSNPKKTAFLHIKDTPTAFRNSVSIRGLSKFKGEWEVMSASNKFKVVERTTDKNGAVNVLIEPID